MYERSAGFQKYFKTGTETQKIDRKNLFEYASVLENLNKNSSIHASGVVIAPSDVTDYVPLSRAKDLKEGSDAMKKCILHTV